MREVTSLLKEFSAFVYIVILLVMVLSGWYSWRSYQAQTLLVEEELHSTAGRVEKSLSHAIRYTEYMLKYLSTQVEGRWDDLDYIDSILHSFRVDQDINTVLSWNMFSWTDAYHRVRVNSVRRVLARPIDVSEMTNMPATMIEPGVLQLGKPTIGGISGQFLIPASLGVVDSNGKYVGAIGTGLQLESIINKVEGFIGSTYINFALLDVHTLEPVVRSAHEQSSKDPEIQQKLLHFLKNDDKEEVLSGGWFFGQHQDYTLFRAIPDTPYILLLSYQYKALEKVLSNQLATQLLQFLLIGGTVILIVYILYQRIIEPIIELSRAADRISAGEREVYMPSSRYNEVNNLAGKLRQIAGYIVEVETVRDQLKQANAQIEAAHMELKNLNDTLEERVRKRTLELEDALAVRQKFVRNASHEVRMPIQIMTFALEPLLEMWDVTPDAERKALIQSTVNGGARLLQLVNQLLDLSKISEGKADFDIMPNDLTLVVHQEMEDAKSIAHNREKKPLFFQFTCRTPHVVIPFDPVRIGQVLRNLFTNAIRYSKEGLLHSQIYDREICYEDGRILPGLAFSLTDEGIGVPDSEKQRIFEVFEQSSRTDTGAGGTGLGLSVSMEIIRAHRGVMWVEDNPIGKGSTFTFVLPRE